MNSQSYLAHVAARAVILIEADNPVIGLMAFVPVGMSEVSSCLIGPKVTPGYHVGKGEELGYFQYGGSTHCLVFRPGAIAEFHPRGNSRTRPQGTADARPLEARHGQHSGLRRGGWPQGAIVKTCGSRSLSGFRLGVLAGPFDEFAVDEGRSGADQGDEVGCVDGAPAVLR